MSHELGSDAPDSHWQMCMHAATTSAWLGPGELLLHACTATPTATAVVTLSSEIQLLSLMLMRAK